MAEEKRALEEELQKLKEQLAASAQAAQEAIAREKTLREQLEAELALLQMVLKQMPCGLLVAEAASGKVVLHNEQAERISRQTFSPAATIQELHKLTRGFARDGRPYSSEQCPIVRSVRNGEVVDGEEIDFLHADGSRSTTSFSSAPIRDGEGRIVAGVAVFTDITGRKEAEQEREHLLAIASRQAAELDEIVECTVDAVFVADAQGMLVRVNKAGLELLGLKSEEQALRPLADYSGLAVFRYPDGRVIPPEEYALTKALRGETLTSYVFTSESPDGEVRWASVSGAPVRDERGNIIAAVNIARDITEQERAHEAQLESEERFRALSEATFEAVIIHEGGKTLEVNHAFVDIFGYERREVIGKTGTELLIVSPESRDELWERIRSGYEEPYEIMGVRKDGTTFPMEVEGKAIVYQGRPALVAAVRDITQRKRAEAERERLSTQLKLLLESTDEGIYGVDLQNNCTFINKSGAAMLGYKPEELLGKNTHELLHHTRPDGSPYPASDCPLSRAM